MHKSKLIKLLKTLTRDEFRHLGKFIKSPFFNTNEDIIKLYDYLRDNNHYPNFDASVLNKEYVDKKLFSPNSANYTFVARRIRDCMSAFSLLVQEFMISIEARRERELNKDLLLLSAFSKRNLHNLFEAKTQEATDKLENLDARGIQYYQTLFELQNNYFFHPDTSKLQRSSTYINGLMENLDAFYILTKLKLSCEIRSREHILSEHYQIDLLQEVTELAKQQHKPNNVLFPIYSDLLYLFSNGFEEIVYNKLKKHYFDNLKSIPFDEQKIILQYLINILYRAVGKKTQEASELLLLYKAGLKNKILFLNDRITPESYSNIAIIGSKIGKFEWTYQFIMDYEQFLDEGIRKDTKQLSLAYWHFNQAEYDKTLQLIDEQEIPGKLFHLRTRALMLRAYFEKFLQDNSFYNLLLSNADSFRKQLDRDNLISEQKRLEYKNFVKYTSLLAKLIWNKKATFKKRLEKLRVDLKEQPKINARIWLLEKVSEQLKLS